MVVSSIGKSFSRIFGSRNDRLLKSYRKRVALINTWEEKVRPLTDAQLRAKTAEFRQRIANGEAAPSIVPEALAVAREVMDRAVGIRSIFNPATGFDPGRLSPQIAALYQQVKAQADALPPVALPGSSQPVERWMETPQFDLNRCRVMTPGWMQVEIPNEMYAAVRELYPLSRPPFRARPFDVQLLGGLVLSEGKIAEMRTGEGKTIVAPLACYIACLENLQAHVVTVNDYLVQRDRDWVFPFYTWLGLTVGAIHPMHVQPPPVKAEAYRCDVVYGTNSEFGFDYLRDNMKLSLAEQVQRRRDFVIIDEVDSILIDEARTPLIISGPAHDDAPRYGLADKVAAHLIQQQRNWNTCDEKVQQAKMRIKGLEGEIRNARDKAKVTAYRDEIKQLEAQLPDLEAARDQFTQYYEIEMERKAAHLTHEGVAEAQRVADIGSFYVGNNMDFPHLLENALRAHAVYQRDKDYVVQNGEVVIVDEFTGRLMVGRQWSDGLHQAVEAKESVKIKQETQTLATITIQNFAKLYRRRAGMTGTAITEATEFNEIYRLDVVCIPTNLPVVRTDREDLIYLSAKDKWDAILDEIKVTHDVGRPVLVGTTSVEKSEMLSQRLTRKHGIQHAVLNAKQHEKEASIVAHAGELGAVMIATNMAGRGTDIKLTPVDRAGLIRHWQTRNLLPKEADAAMPDAELVERAYRHMGLSLLGLSKQEAKDKPLDEIRVALCRAWAERFAYVEPKKLPSMGLEELHRLLDAVPGFLLHKLAMWEHIEQMGGLHIIGTERHESRRIDNQLRGRAGRQGDRGSSRFFISLEDDLMKLFAGNTTMNVLSKMGMKEGDAIEHRWITKSVERAQRKVEERNYQIRKNLLEYDEVMEYQRGDFYGTRQRVLEGHDLRDMIFGYIQGAVDEAAETYLDRDYVPTQIAEWCRANLDVSIEPMKLRADDLDELIELVRREARNEVVQTVEVTLGEYMSNEMDPQEWDLRGLCQWAMSRFRVDLKQNQVRQMNPSQVSDLLREAALEQLERRDLTGIAAYLEPLYAEKQLAAWVQQKLDFTIDPQTLAPREEENATDRRQRVVDQVLDEAQAAYEQREILYPVEYVLDMTFHAAQQNGDWAAQQLCQWVNSRYELGWTPEQVKTMTRADLTATLAQESRAWQRDGGVERMIDAGFAQHPDEAARRAWASQRLQQRILETEPVDRDALLARARALYRAELTQLERFVLLQILDQCWKDHLYAMDQLKDSVGLRGYAERDPRIEYKREGAAHYAAMLRLVQERVAELIFRARLTPNVQQRSAYQPTQVRHDAAAGSVARQQQADRDAADRAGTGESGGDRHLSRQQRRAAAARKRRQ